MHNEHYKLARDLFQGLTLGFFGIAFFVLDASVPAKALSVIMGAWCQLAAHVFVAYDRRDERNGATGTEATL